MSEWNEAIEAAAKQALKGDIRRLGEGAVRIRIAEEIRALAAPAAAEPRSDNMPQFIRDNIERAQQKELSEDVGICYFDAHPHRYQITCYEWKLTPRPVAEPRWRGRATQKDRGK